MHRYSVPKTAGPPAVWAQNAKITPCQVNHDSVLISRGPPSTTCSIGYNITLRDWPHSSLAMTLVPAARTDLLQNMYQYAAITYTFFDQQLITNGPNGNNKKEAALICDFRNGYF